MMPNGALIIEGHIQGLSNVRALGEWGIPVYVADCTRCIAQYSKYCTKAFRCPPFLSDEFIPFLVHLGQTENFSNWLILASNDHIVEQLSKHKQELSPYYSVVVPDYCVLTKIVDKQALASLAASVGTHVPASCDSTSIQDSREMRFPVLIKGRNGLSFYKTLHKKAIIANTPEELATTVKGIPPQVDFFIQEKIQNSHDEAISFSCFSVDGSIKSYWMGAKIREHPLRFGTATFAQSVLIPELLTEATPLISALSYTGICEIEFMFDERDGHYKLIEINPRTWLWVGLARRCGCDFALMMYNFANGIRQTFPSQYKVGVKWVNLMTDIPYSAKAIAKGHLSVKDYLASFHGETVHAVWNLHDLKPALVLPFLSFHILKHRR